MIGRKEGQLVVVVRGEGARIARRRARTPFLPKREPALVVLQSTSPQTLLDYTASSARTHLDVGTLEEADRPDDREAVQTGAKCSTAQETAASPVDGPSTCASLGRRHASFISRVSLAVSEPILSPSTLPRRPAAVWGSSDALSEHSLPVA